MTDDCRSELAGAVKQSYFPPRHPLSQGSGRVSELWWDSWRGSMDGRPTLWEKRVWSFAGRVIDLHKMVAKDDPDCFHTHPSYAIRFVLWGGYVEEIEGGAHRMWRPGMVGIVPPSLSHRVAGLRNGRTSYSIWIRLRKRAKVELRGEGWHQQEQIFRAPGTVFPTPSNIGERT